MFNKAQQDYDFLVWRQKLVDENIMYKNAWPEFRLTFEEFVANRPAMLAKHQHGLYHEDGKRRDQPLVVGD